MNHAAAGVVACGEFTSYGDVERVFGWASVTKMVTALAVLIGCEEGTVSLSLPAGPEGSTVRHLLAHASGLPGPPSRVRVAGVPSIDTRRPVAAPGERRIYSNLGFEMLAEMLAERSGFDFSTYLNDGIVEPLGMESTRVESSPAWGGAGTLHDLLALGAELLAPRLISAETLSAASSVNFPRLSGVLPGYGMMRPNDWGLGFEIRDTKRPHWTGSLNSAATFGHFGQSGAFLWVDPEAGIACAALSDRPFGRWAKRAWPELSDAVLTALD